MSKGSTNVFDALTFAYELQQMSWRNVEETFGMKRTQNWILRAGGTAVEVLEDVFMTVGSDGFTTYHPAVVAVQAVVMKPSRLPVVSTESDMDVDIDGFARRMTVPSASLVLPSEHMEWTNNFNVILLGSWFGGSTMSVRAIISTRKRLARRAVDSYTVCIERKLTTRTFLDINVLDSFRMEAIGRCQSSETTSDLLQPTGKFNLLVCGMIVCTVADADNVSHEESFVSDNINLNLCFLLNYVFVCS